MVNMPESAYELLNAVALFAQPYLRKQNYVLLSGSAPMGEEYL